MEIRDASGKVVAKFTARGHNVWLEIQTDDGTKPVVCLIQNKDQGLPDKGWYIGLYRDINKVNDGCDVAVMLTEEDGPIIQAVKDGEAVSASLFDLLKLVQK